MNTTVQTYFEQRAQNRTWGSLYEGRLDARTYNFLTRREAVLRLLEPEGTFARVLDVGCGTGDYAQVAWRHKGVYYGVDFSSTMVAQAHAQLHREEQQALLLVGSGEELPYQENSFDLILAMGYIEYFQDPTSALREIRRVLKPGGTLVIQSYQRELFGTFDRFIRKTLRPIYRWATRRGRAPAGPAMGIDQPYSQRRLDGLLQQFDFVRTGYALNHFAVFPEPFRSKLLHQYARLSEAIGRSGWSCWSVLAVNYIGKYVLNKP